MDAIECIMSRKDYKRFDPKKKIPRDILINIMMAGGQAPSAGNYQPWRYLIVDKEDLKEKVANATYQTELIRSAPVVIVVCARQSQMLHEFGEDAGKMYTYQNVGASIENMLLAAHAFGLAGRWIMLWNDITLRRLLDMRSWAEIQGLVALGYPVGTPIEQDRKHLAHMTYWNYLDSSSRKAHYKHAFPISQHIGPPIAKAKEKLYSKLMSLGKK